MVDKTTLYWDIKPYKPNIYHDNKKIVSSAHGYKPTLTVELYKIIGLNK
jgi:hypothetical protein